MIAKKPNSHTWESLGAAGADRAAVVAFLFEHRELIHRRIRGKLRHAIDVWVDADDVLSTVLRRIDHAWQKGDFRPENERGFWAYVFVVAENSIATRVREARREREVLHGRARDPSWVETERKEEMIELTPVEFGELLPEARDRELFELRKTGVPFAVIASVTGRSEASLRAQWMLVRRKLRSLLAARIGSG